MNFENVVNHVHISQGASGDGEEKMEKSTTVVVSLVADYGRFYCQTAIIFMRTTNVEFTNVPAIKFNTC